MFNHTMVYDGFRPDDLREIAMEITVWDHDRLSNHFIGGLRIGIGSGMMKMMILLLIIIIIINNCIIDIVIILSQCSCCVCVPPCLRNARFPFNPLFFTSYFLRLFNDSGFAACPDENLLVFFFWCVCAGRSYGADVAWMDSTAEEVGLWERMMQAQSEWVEAVLPLRMLLMARAK